jgi:aerotolerance regulator-like protein/VWA domain-containing protein
MQFLSPIMLAGAAAIAIPIALHFFFRARYRPLLWAPMRFLKEAIEQTSRRLRFQEWILLALRCLAIILLALALARPGWKTAVTAGRGEAIDAVLVIDTSYTMAARDGDRTRLDRAREAALAVLDTLPANSSVQVFSCSDRATLLGPRERFNLDQARQIVGALEVTSLSTDLYPGITEAFAAAQSGTAPAKEIYVFTDMQRSGFERQSGALKAKCEEIRSQANLVFIRCGNPERKTANVAVLDVKLVSDIPHTRTRVPFEIILKNTGADTVKGLRVNLILDGRAVEKDAVQVDAIEPNQIFTLMLTGSLDEAGQRMVEVQIEGDGLPGDNVLYKTVLVRDKVRILLVDGTPNPDNPLEAGDHFVRTALNPGLVPDYYIESDTVSAVEASPRHLEDKDIVYLLNVPLPGERIPLSGEPEKGNRLAGLPEEFVDKLAEFVRAGGGLVIACGDRVRDSLDQVEVSGAGGARSWEPRFTYNRVFGSGGAKLLPFDFKGVREAPENAPFAPAPESVADASFLSRFRAPGEERGLIAGLRNVTIQSMMDVNETTVDGRVLVSTTDGRPIIASREVGEGAVVLVTASLDETWGRFPAESSAFVPFTRMLIAHLTSRRVPGGTATAGNPLVWVSPEGNRVEYELVKPRKLGETQRERVKLEVPEGPRGGKTTVTAADTPRAGIYNIVPVGMPDDAGPLFAVNPDLRETADTTTATDDAVENWLGYRPPIIAAGAGTEAAVSQLRTRSEWTEWVLLFLLLLLVGEALWAWLCGRAW